MHNGQVLIKYIRQLFLCNNKLNEKILREFIDAFPV